MENVKLVPGVKLIQEKACSLIVVERRNEDPAMGRRRAEEICRCVVSGQLGQSSLFLTTFSFEFGSDQEE